MTLLKKRKAISEFLQGPYRETQIYGVPIFILVTSDDYVWLGSLSKPEGETFPRRLWRTALQGLVRVLYDAKRIA